MYQVIQTYSENEPWWFFEEWKDDIVVEQTFSSFEHAEEAFLKIYKTHHEAYDDLSCKNPYLVAFWNENELIYCEDCDEDLQAYMGLMLVKDYQKINDGDNTSDETTNYSGKAKCCSRFSQSSRSN